MTTPRKSKVITFSLPPRMAEQVTQLMEDEGRRGFLSYGQRRARELGISTQDVERLVDGYRAEDSKDLNR